VSRFVPEELCDRPNDSVWRFGGDEVPDARQDAARGVWERPLESLAVRQRSHWIAITLERDRRDFD
jgi:hypothetical protein